MGGGATPTLPFAVGVGVDSATILTHWQINHEHNLDLSLHAEIDVRSPEFDHCFFLCSFAVGMAPSSKDVVFDVSTINKNPKKKKIEYFSQ